jgi:hypothetical protein
MGAELFHADRRTDKFQTETYRLFLQCYENAYKQYCWNENLELNQLFMLF